MAEEGIKKLREENFPGGPVVKNPPSNAGDVGSIPSQGMGSHMHATTNEPKKCN